MRAFNENKWKGYVFTKPEYTGIVFKAAEKVLKEIFEIEVNQFARLLCKIEPQEST
jgi:hypothetical protein